MCQHCPGKAASLLEKLSLAPTPIPSPTPIQTHAHIYTHTHTHMHLHTQAQGCGSLNKDRPNPIPTIPPKTAAASVQDEQPCHRVNVTEVEVRKFPYTHTVHSNVIQCCMCQCNPPQLSARRLTEGGWWVHLTLPFHSEWEHSSVFGCRTTDNHSNVCGTVTVSWLLFPESTAPCSPPLPVALLNIPSCAFPQCT